MSTPIAYIIGDATQPQGDGQQIIAHVCNDVGAWGRGFVLALSRRWSAPERIYLNSFRDRPTPSLGRVQLIWVSETVAVANMIAQRGIRSTPEALPAIRYDALHLCLETLGHHAVLTGASVHIPRIGCGLAGGTWEQVEPIVRATLAARGVPTFVYTLPLRRS